MQSYIQIESLSKSYGKHRILSGIDLVVGKGESVAITGPSGCGKTTLLNILGLLETYESGSILLSGKKYPGPETRQAMLLRRNEINYLFQSFALIDSRTVRDNLMLALYYTKLSKREKEGAIEKTLKKFSVSSKLDSNVNELSGGEKQRVAISRAMLKPGNLILADEPTGSLDARMAEIVMDSLVSAARETGKTLVVVTHDMLMADKCDRTLSMQEGKLV
ncbi:ABC transporter ATP-binding protein [Atopobium sp. oral taxon 416]|jgi:putative ABC transport system ATP-binding protein|uniref:ABC transporter ATP-binding protein n=1 Tax=Atopobium sp. oral taxon 416 TaxID=712157 RepID=UPI001BAB4F66|nr:ABC transporter ATP-binding protein [Atopobium sp. oral taxon 416]QUC03994.1 ABC transporter ATP-binding protein [Atopobium sp. oral taxon 416]